MCSDQIFSLIKLSKESKWKHEHKQNLKSSYHDQATARAGSVEEQVIGCVGGCEGVIVLWCNIIWKDEDTSPLTFYLYNNECVFCSNLPLLILTKENNAFHK